MGTLQLTLLAESRFSYACSGCGRCCYGKSIGVNPYEVLLLARSLGVSTGAVLREHVTEDTRTLLRRADGSCTLLVGGRCSAHEGRPAACRIYPLAWVEVVERAPRFGRLPGHPLSEGAWGEAGTVAEYVRQQGLDQFTEPYRRYRAIFVRLVELAALIERHCRDLAVPDIAWFDADAVEGARDADVAAAFELHTAHLETQIAALEQACHAPDR